MYIHVVQPTKSASSITPQQAYSLNTKMQKLTIN